MKQGKAKCVGKSRRKGKPEQKNGDYRAYKRVRTNSENLANDRT